MWGKFSWNLKVIRNPARNKIQLKKKDLFVSFKNFLNTFWWFSASTNLLNIGILADRNEEHITIIALEMLRVSPTIPAFSGPRELKINGVINWKIIIPHM